MNDPFDKANGNPAQTETQIESQPTPSAGRQLAAQREALGWSIEDVASRLNLAPRQVMAIEADDFAALPGMAVTRGFIRAYAKLVNLDAAPLMASLSQESAANVENPPLRRPLPAKPFYGNDGLSKGSERQRTSLWIGLVALALFALAIVAWNLGWLQQYFPSNVKDQLGTSFSQTAPQAESVQTGSTQSAPSSSIATGTGEQQHPIAKDAGEPSSIATTNAPASLNETLPNAPVIGAEAAAANENSDALILKMREDSWVEVKDQANKTLVSRLMKAGETYSAKLEGPIKITIGNAAGVDASLRGVPLELQSASKNNVVRLSLK